MLSANRAHDREVWCVQYGFASGPSQWPIRPHGLTLLTTDFSASKLNIHRKTILYSYNKLFQISLKSRKQKCVMWYPTMFILKNGLSNYQKMLLKFDVVDDGWCGWFEPLRIATLGCPKCSLSLIQLLCHDVSGFVPIIRYQTAHV